MKAIKEDVKHPEYGLASMSTKMNAFKLHCAETSTSLYERVINLEGKRRKPKHIS